VFPHDPTLESVAGPSKPTPRQKHPLGDIYSSSLEAYRSAYEVRLPIPLLLLASGGDLETDLSGVRG